MDAGCHNSNQGVYNEMHMVANAECIISGSALFIVTLVHTLGERCLDSAREEQMGRYGLMYYTVHMSNVSLKHIIYGLLSLPDVSTFGNAEWVKSPC